MRQTPFACALLALCLALAPLHGADQPEPSGPPAAAESPESADARDFLGLGGRTQWLGVLTEAANSLDAPTRARAAFLMGQICAGADERQRGQCEKALTALAEDPDRSVRIHAGIALGHLGHESAAPTCAAALVDGPRWRRYYAVVALAGIGTSGARGILVGGLDGQSQYIRDAADYFLLPPDDRPRNPGREAEYAVASPGPPPPAGTAPEAIFAAAADALWVMGDHYWHSNGHEDCIRIGLAATFLDPTHVGAWDGAAWLAWSAGRDAEAIRIYLDGLNANPTDYELYFELGFHLYNTRRYRAALPYLRRATELPCPPLAFRMYAHCLQKAGQLDKCLEVWAGLLEQTPRDQVVIQNHARVKRLVETAR
ncbi:MAG: HEAT repeat domain-containing protein [Armatimonadota bacterium]|jgi:tetratricopeptide (TPR) repeat protein